MTMASLPTFDECRCPCHDPVYGMAVSHAAACCEGGKTLAWSSWGIDDVAEMVTTPVEFSAEETS